jgi:hypothetical protein
MLISKRHFRKFGLKHALFIALLCAVGCKCNQKSAKAPDALTETIPIDIPPSTFNIPVSYSLVELEHFVNAKFTGVFLETVVHSPKHSKDSLKIRLERFKPIRITSDGSELTCTFPLKATATILNSRFNFITKKIDPIETELLITLRTPVALDKNWHLVTNFSLVKTTWVKEPEISLGILKINLRKKIDPLLETKKEALTNRLDKDINKTVSLEKPVSKVWHNLQKPILVNKRKPPHLYLKFICKSISGNFVLGQKEITCYTAINAQVVFLTDPNEKTTTNSLPPFVKQNKTLEYSDVNVYAFSAYEDMNYELDSLLTGKKFSAKGMNAVIEHIEVYGSDSGLTAVITTKGDIESKLVATGMPAFDSSTQTIYVKSFGFDVATNNILVNTGDALLHQKIRDTVKQALTLGLDTLIAKIPHLIEKGIAAGKPGKSIDVAIRNFELRRCQFALGARGIHIRINVRLAAGIDLKHLKAGKKVQLKPKNH